MQTKHTQASKQWTNKTYKENTLREGKIEKKKGGTKGDKKEAKREERREQIKKKKERSWAYVGLFYSHTLASV